MKSALQFAALSSALKLLGLLPRPLARSLAALLAKILYLASPKLRKTARINLQIAFPALSGPHRKQIERGMIRNLAWMAAEFARLPRYTPENIHRYVVLAGHEHFLEAHRRGKGVLYLTGHIGAWELSSYAHALYGFPLHYMARPIDNPRIDALVNRYRGRSGNRPIFKNESARAMLKILKDSGTVGILADQNTMPGEGAFVDFFGTPACTTTGIARVALHTGAAVVPGYAVWDASLQKYRLQFEPAVELIRTGNDEHDVLANTQRFAKIIESIIRRYPDQWVWIHARWNTRPPGSPSLYPFR